MVLSIQKFTAWYEEAGTLIGASVILAGPFGGIVGIPKSHSKWERVLGKESV